MIDIFSRYAFTIAVKSKSGKDVLNGFVKLMKQFHEKFGKYPKRVQADEGKEFFKINFSEYLKHKNIEFFVTKSQKKAVIVEKFNRTLKNIMWRFMDEKGEKNWNDFLSDFTYNYNHSVHRTIGMRPIDVAPPKFQIGDKVRVSRYKSTFAKGYKMTFHNEVYTIYKTYRGSPTVYKLIDEKDGETIFGRFYEWELQTANAVQGVSEAPEKQDERMPESRVEGPKRNARTQGPMDKYTIRTGRAKGPVIRAKGSVS